MIKLQPFRNAFRFCIALVALFFYLHSHVLRHPTSIAVRTVGVASSSWTPSSSFDLSLQHLFTCFRTKPFFR
jgi:hypothetical protein